MTAPRLEVTEHRIACDGMPVDLVRLAICGWLERHSIDPSHAAVPGWIERDIDRRIVLYEDYERDAEGKVILQPGAKDVRRVTRTMQLEAPPLPWPRIVALHIRPPREDA